MRAPAKHPSLLLISASVEGGTSNYLIGEGETTIGRSSDSDICLLDRSVSRAHCKLVRHGSDVRIVDVSGKNRLWVGDRPAGDRPLRHGDVLRIGNCRLRFRASRDMRPRGSVTARRAAVRRRSLTVSVVAVALVFAVGIAFMVWWLTAGPESGPTRTVVRREADNLPTVSPVVSVGPVAPVAPIGLAPSIDGGGSVESQDERAGLRVAVLNSTDAGSERGGVLSASFKVDMAKIDSAVMLEDAERDVRADADPEALAVSVPTSFTYYDTHVTPFLRKHCLSCHGKKRQKGELSFDDWADETAAVVDREVWKTVAQRLRKKDMPPSNKRQPEPAESAAIIAWIEASVLRIALDGQADPGRVTMRRLNNYEYNYTIRDLTGLDLDLADGFPADDIGYGFDNIADVLSIPPLLMEKYLGAAAKISRAVMEDDKARARLMICTPKKKTDVRSCAKKILRAFGERAYRRPLKTTESSRLVKLFDLAIKNGDDFEKGIEIGIQALLASPHFLFRVELDSRPNDANAIRALTDWELASRLSYFLWSSLPDDELLGLARSRRLSDSLVLENQVRRMLQDSRARGLVKTFSAMWLGSRAMKTVSPDSATYPDFDEALRRGMRMETELFFQEIMREDLSVLLFLDSDFTFLNERLARHYGIGGVYGSEVRRVTLDSGRRGGVLTQGTVLTVTSNPTRTSPVKRGKWLLEQILGAPPPPPPPGADVFSEETAKARDLNVRQKMVRHRRDPGCAVCHRKMDTLGLALENYDGIGAWRDRDGGVEVDPSGTLADGGSFRSPAQFKRVLLERREDFCRCLAEKMLTFALGRGLEYADTPTVDAIVRSLEASGHRFSALILGVVRSEPFRKRRGERMAP